MSAQPINGSHHPHAAEPQRGRRPKLVTDVAAESGPRAPSIFSDLLGALEHVGAARDWFAEGAIEGAPIVVWAAPEKGGKSWTAMQLAVATVTGGKWLGRFAVKREGTPFYVDTEYGAHEFARRLARIARAEGSDPRHVLGAVRHVWCPYMQLHHDDDAAKALLREVKLQRPPLIVLDPWRNFLVGSENNSDDTIEAMRIAAQLRDASGGVVLIPHHLNKQGETSGSRALLGRADLIFSGSDEDEPAYTAKGRTVRHRDPIRNAMRVVIAHDDDEDDTIARTLVRCRFDGESGAAELGKSAKRVQQHMAKVQVPITMRALRTALGMNNQVATRALEELLNARAITRDGDKWSLAASEFFAALGADVEAAF